MCNLLLKIKIIKSSKLMMMIKVQAKIALYQGRIGQILSVNNLTLSINLIKD